MVAAAQGGDRFALDQLLRHHYDRIHAVCRRIAGSTRDADDACQEALIKIVRNLPRFDGRAAFGTWAYRIATNAALDELRKRARRPGLHAVADHDRVEAADPTATTPTDWYPDRLLLDDALDRLPDDLRIAVVLRDVADLDYAAIADTLDVPVGTVKSRISRGRAALARQLGPQLDEQLALQLQQQLDDADDWVVDEPDGVTDPPRGNRTPPEQRPTDLT